MSSFGQVNEYNENVESWTQYSERIAQYFLANDIADETKKRAILLTVIGPNTYGLLRNLLSPVKPTEKPMRK